MTNSVRVSTFYTRNLGNFENVKVGYEIEVDVKDGETFEQTRARAKAKVQEWVSQDVNEIDADAGN